MDGKIEPIYYLDEGVAKLLPEFIYGYVPVEKGGKLGKIKNNPKYKDIHNLNNVNLLYDESAIYKAKREGIKLGISNISLDDKYNIIKKAYQDTLLKYGNYQAEQALLNLINNDDVKYFTGKENRSLLSKYIVYGDILKILCMSNIKSENLDVNSIINNFINESNMILDQRNKLK